MEDIILICFTALNFSFSPKIQYPGGSLAKPVQDRTVTEKGFEIGAPGFDVSFREMEPAIGVAQYLYTSYGHYDVEITNLWSLHSPFYL